MKNLTHWLVFATLLASPVSFARAQEPAAKQDKPVAKAAPVYDEAADARAELKAALARAKTENRRVLIQWGANWCGWCVALHGTLTKDAPVARKLMYEYDVVRVDVGHFDKNMDLAAELGADFKATGIPFLTVLDANGKPLAQRETGTLELVDKTKTAHDTTKVLAFLTEHQAPYLQASEVRAAAFARAKAEDKRVFLHFGAPWCGWCHRLEGWMAQPAITALLAKDFVELKIDTDRMVGGEELLAAARASAGLTAGGGIPWIVFYDADGNALANSEGNDGNIGFPYQPAEIEHFIGMLKKTAMRLTRDDIDALSKSLNAIREADEAKKKAAAEAGAKK